MVVLFRARSGEPGAGATYLPLILGLEIACL